MAASETGRQLALDLPFEERRGVEDFFISESNEAAFAAIDAWPDGWVDPLLILVGPQGAGKSHLAAIWAGRAHAWRPAAGEVTLAAAPHLMSGGALLIEDIDRGTIDEAALFHVINGIRERKGSMLVTARAEPSAWPIATPDLMSRLRRAPLASIGAPDDALLRALLIKLFMDRQLTVDTGIIETIIKRAERSFAAARAIVDALDQAALAAGRRITRAMALNVVAQLSDGREVEP